LKIGPLAAGGARAPRGCKKAPSLPCATLLRTGSFRPTDRAPAASHCTSAVVSAAVVARSVRPPWGEYPPLEGSARRSPRLAAAGSSIFQVCADHVPVPGRGAPQGVYPPSAGPCAPGSPLCPSVRPVPAPAVCVPAKCLRAAIPADFGDMLDSQAAAQGAAPSCSTELPTRQFYQQSEPAGAAHAQGARSL
jgi:hypothetical protein